MRWPFQQILADWWTYEEHIRMTNKKQTTMDQDQLIKTHWQPPSDSHPLNEPHFPSLAAQADKASANCSCPWMRPWVWRVVNKGGSKARGNGAYEVGEDVVVGLACLTWRFWWLGGLPWWVASWVKRTKQKTVGVLPFEQPGWRLWGYNIVFGNSIPFRKLSNPEGCFFSSSSIKLKCFKFCGSPSTTTTTTIELFPLHQPIQASDSLWP